MKPRDIAETVGMSTTQISNLLSGRSKFIHKTACLFHDTFGLSPAWLMAGEGEILGYASPSFFNGGNRLRQFLEEKGISKAEASRRVGIAPCEISSLIGRKRRLTANLSERISSALGVSASWLLTGEGPMELEEWEPPAELPQTGTAVRDGQREKEARLRKENAELREDVERLRGQVSQLLSVVQNLAGGKTEQ